MTVIRQAIRIDLTTDIGTAEPLTSAAIHATDYQMSLRVRNHIDLSIPICSGVLINQFNA